jgi:hypothetical protein
MAMLSFSELLSLSSPPLSSDATAISVYSTSDIPALACTPSSVSTAITNSATTAFNFSLAVATNVDVNQNQKGLRLEKLDDHPLELSMLPFKEMKAATL